MVIQFLKDSLAGLRLTKSLKHYGLDRVVDMIADAMGGTDLFGALVNWAKWKYAIGGHTAVARMVTIKEASLRKWSERVNPGDSEAADEVVQSMDAAAQAFATLVRSLMPNALKDLFR